MTECTIIPEKYDLPPMNSRLAQYQTASKIFVNREMLDEDVIGIIVSGSSVHGKPDKNSDVDIHVILRPDCDYRE